MSIVEISLVSPAIQIDLSSLETAVFARLDLTLMLLSHSLQILHDNLVLLKYIEWPSVVHNRVDQKRKLF